MRHGLLLLAHATLLIAANVSAGVFQVTTAADSGPGSLRQAIVDSNGSAGADEIRFATTEGQPFRIVVTTALPEIMDPVSIDGRTAAGYNGVPIVELNGNNRDMSHGLKFGPGGSGSSIFALAINGFGANAPAHGIWFADSDNNLVDGCRIGVNAPGDAALRNRGDGVVIQASDGNRIINSIISGNRSYGVHILGPNANGNEVSNCSIGLNAAKIAAIGNFRAGIGIEQAIGTTIHGNTISGNTGPQIEILGNASAGTLIYGNNVGTKGDGAALVATPASAHGIRIDGAPQTVIGGDEPAERNIIGGVNFGINISNAGANGTVIANNFIGVDVTGAAPAPNQIGIYIGAGSSGATVGGPAPAWRNVISANRQAGISISDSSDNRVLGNYIGLNAAGAAPLGNTTPGTSGAGLAIAAFTGQARNNIIGGATADAANFITGNNADAVQVAGGGATANQVSCNVIGVSGDFTQNFGNAGHGIVVLGADNNLFEANFVIKSGNAGAPMEGIFFGRAFKTTGDAGTGNIARNNLIAESSGDGVACLDPNDPSDNAFAGNFGLPIDVANDGPNANYPELSFVARNPWRIAGSLRGAPNCAYRVHVYGIVNRWVPREFDSVLGTFRLERNDQTITRLDSFTVTTAADGLAFFSDQEFQGAVEGMTFKLVAYAECDGEPGEFSPSYLLVAEPPQSVIAFSAPVFHLREGGDTTLRIVRAGDPSQAASVQLETFLQPAGSSPWAVEAITGIEVGPSTLQFAAGQTEVVFGMVIADDSQFSGTRVFGARLSNPAGATLGLSSAVVFVGDNEMPRPAMAFDFMEAPRPQVLVNGVDGAPVAVEFTRDLTGGGIFEIAGENGIAPFHPSELFAPGEDQSEVFFRAAIREGLGVLDVEVAGGDGGAAEAATRVFVGRGGEALPNDGLVLGVPPGQISLQIEQRGTLVDTVSGQSSTEIPRIFLPVRITPGALEEVVLRADFAVNLDPLTADSRRNPWSALAVSIVGGEKTVTAGGGALGDEIGIDAFLVRAPGDVQIVVDPRDPNRVFMNAASGQWTVTATVDGKSETASVTVP